MIDKVIEVVRKKVTEGKRMRKKLTDGQGMIKN